MLSFFVRRLVRFGAIVVNSNRWHVAPTANPMYPSKAAPNLCTNITTPYMASDDNSF